MNVESNRSPSTPLRPHVFIAMADILHLNCDAWLLPTGVEVKISDYWKDGNPDLERLAHSSAGPEFRSGSKLAQAVDGWLQDSALPILTSVTVSNLWPSGELQKRIHAFAQAAVEAIPSRPSYRALPLLAIPFFGTAGGGAGRNLGEMLTQLLQAAVSASLAYEVDVAIVLRDKAAFALAQKLRREKKDIYWSSLSSDQLELAESLAAKARKGTLVPFLGAGVSVSAGAPDWKKLIGKLSDHVSLESIGPGVFAALPVLDQAGLLEQLFEKQKQPGEFRETICQEVTMLRYGLAPALLATLPAAGTITLNYDTLFETACLDAKQPRTVIPDDHPTAGDRWLLKLHGTVTKPETIVLTRGDYLDHTANRQALSALVKAHLVTHHMLFVGFGLEDDHFHEIVHDVRRALPQQRLDKSRPFGTVLTLRQQDPKQHLWRGQLEFASASDAESNAGGNPLHEPEALLAAGRKLEIFLDALAAFSSDNHSYLLAPLYTKGLGAEETSLRSQLLQVADSNRQEESEVGSVLRESLMDLGWDPAYSYPKKVFRRLGSRRSFFSSRFKNQAH
ncbi:SIR2 family protein [Pseudarthrobacter chlorophenolicus]|uniref:SIR2 family protein n=1 Tax=Pseudarthrobacter chlorophenolicus TaxID=85085 RepID=UPI00126A6B4B|nr:SIR2 family protein [Pseudarthrobacter chlorophenolicus]